MLFKISRRFFRFKMIGRIVQHGGTHAVLSFLAHEDVVVDTAFAARPKLFIIGEFRIGYRFVAQVGVDLHHREAGGEPEYFCMRVFFPAQLKDPFLDGFGNAAFAKFRRHDQTAVGHELVVPPGFDVAKPNPLAGRGKRDDRFAFIHLLNDVIGRTLGDTGAPGFGGSFHFIGDGGSVYIVSTAGNPYEDVICFQLLKIERRLKN